MQLDNLLSAADPTRQAQIDDADSPRATALYRRIVATPPSRGGGGVATSTRGPAEIGGPAHGRTARLIRQRSVVAVAAAAAVAVTFSVVALTGGAREAHNTLADGAGKPSASPRSSASARPSPRTSSPGSQPGPPNEAAPVLDALAATAAGEPPTSLVPGPGKYLYVLDVELKGAPPGGGKSMACGSVIRQQWLASDSSGHQVINQPGCAQYPRIVQNWRPGANGAGFDFFAWEGLPTEPAAMEAAIVKRLETGHGSNPETFSLATTVLNVAAPPTMRAALFRMLATLPDVHYLGKVTDPLGRTGDTIGFVEKPDDIVAIFNPKTSQVMDALLVPYAIHHLPRLMPPWDTPELFVETGIVGSTRATPPGTKELIRKIPYWHWVW